MLGSRTTTRTVVLRPQPTGRPAWTVIDTGRPSAPGPHCRGAGGPPNGLARDLRPDESLGPTYTSGPLATAVQVLGVPEVVLHLSVSALVATAVVRLSDVAPDGTSAQVTAGILNLTHRRSHERPEPLVPGRVEEIRVRPVPTLAIGMVGGLMVGLT